MKPEKLQFILSVDVFKTLSDLPEEQRKLINEAERIMADAYAPYSQFKVGAAVLLANGEIVSGSNQENAAYPSGLCAERVALFYAGAQFKNVAIKAIAVVCDSKSDKPVTPCGACRQVMAEYEQNSGKHIQVLMATPGGRVYTVHSVEALLPLGFGKGMMK